MLVRRTAGSLIMVYFKRKDCLQRNLYLNCVSLLEKVLKVSDIVWFVSTSAVICRVVDFSEWSPCGLFISLA